MPTVTTDQQQQYCAATYNTTNLTSAMSDAVSELTELIKQQESISTKPALSPSNVSGVGTSNSDSISDDHHILNRQQQSIHHNFHDDDFMQVCIYKNILIMLKN